MLCGAWHVHVLFISYGRTQRSLALLKSSALWLSSQFYPELRIDAICRIMATGCRTSSGFVTPRSLQIDPTSAHLMSTISKVDNLMIYPFCIYKKISYIHGWSSSTHLRISTTSAVFCFVCRPMWSARPSSVLCGVRPIFTISPRSHTTRHSTTRWHDTPYLDKHLRFRT